MTKELTLDLVQSQMRPRQRLTVSEDTVKEIQKLATIPDYGEEFLECYIDHLNVFKESGRTHRQYLNAIKFFSLVEAGNTLTDAYIKVFPERFQARAKNKDNATDKKDIMRGEASRFNGSSMVNEIRRVATIPVQLIHRHLLHEAIAEQADLMRNARSEMVRQKAGATLIAELKPLEDHVVKVDVNDGSTSIIAELHKAAQKLAIEQQATVLAGGSVKDIAGAKLVGTVIEGETTDD